LRAFPEPHSSSQPHTSFPTAAAHPQAHQQRAGCGAPWASTAADFETGSKSMDGRASSRTWASPQWSPQVSDAQSTAPPWQQRMAAVWSLHCMQPCLSRACMLRPTQLTVLPCITPRLLHCNRAQPGCQEVGGHQG
jgi:hypothetical protein